MNGYRLGRLIEAVELGASLEALPSGVGAEENADTKSRDSVTRAVGVEARSISKEDRGGEIGRRVGPKRPCEGPAIGCDRCVLPDNYAGASFAQHETLGNVCNFCSEFRKREFLGEEQFIYDLDLGSDEKVGVTVSGGKDSARACGWLVERFGPERVVALHHHKAGLRHPLARRNLSEIGKRTALIEVVDRRFLPRFRNNLRALLSCPDPAMVRVALCAGCRAGISVDLFRKARKLGITKIVNGASYLELAPFKTALMKRKGEGEETRGLVQGLVENELYEHRGNLSSILKDHVLCHESCFHRYAGRNRFHGISYFDFFDYFINDPLEVRQYVQAELDYELPTGGDWHFDCYVEIFKDLFYWGLLGYTETDFHLSEQVRYELLPRKEAIEMLLEKRREIATGTDRVIEQARYLGCDDETVRQLQAFVDRSEYL